MCAESSGEWSLVPSNRTHLRLALHKGHLKVDRARRGLSALHQWTDKRRNGIRASSLRGIARLHLPTVCSRSTIYLRQEFGRTDVEPSCFALVQVPQETLLMAIELEKERAQQNMNGNVIVSVPLVHSAARCNSPASHETRNRNCW